MASRRSGVFFWFISVLAGSAVIAPGCSSDSDGSNPKNEGGSSGASPGAGGSGGGSGTGGDAGAGSGGGGSSGTAGRGGTGTSGAAGAGGDTAGGGQGGDSGQGGTGGGHNDGVDLTLTMYRGTVQANAALVVWREGDGDWQELTGGGGLYRFTSLDEHYSLAIVCQRDKTPDPGQVVSITSLRALTSEITSIVRTCSVAPSSPLPQYSVTVNVTGLTSTMTASAYVGATLLNYTSTMTNNSLMLSQGLQAVLVTRRTTGALDRFLYSPDNDIRGATTLSFNPTADGVAPTTGTLSATGAAAADLEFAVDLYSSDGRLVNAFYATGTASTTYYALPASALTGTAVQFASAVVVDSATRRQRAIGRYAKGFSGNVALAVPDALATPTVSIASPNRVVIELAPRAGTQLFFSATSQIAGDDSRSTVDYVTAGYARTAPVVLENPELSFLDAWDASYEYVAGTNVNWSVSAQTSNRRVADAFANVRQVPSQSLRADLDGFQIDSAAINGTILP